MHHLHHTKVTCNAPISRPNSGSGAYNCSVLTLAMGSAPKAKPTTKVALIGLTPATAQVFSNSFRHFSIEPVIFDCPTRVR